MAASLILMQLADSAFPTGGFAHSGGLEAALALEEVTAETLPAYIEQSLDNAASAQLPYVTATHGEPSVLVRADAICHASMPSEIASRASRAQGRAWLAAAAAFGHEGLVALEEHARRAEIAAHVAPVFGATCGVLALPRGDVQRLFLFLHLRGLVSSAVRLGILGPLAAQRLQWSLGPTLEAAWARSRDLDLHEAFTTAPLHEILQGHHDRLYSRMFSS